MDFRRAFSPPKPLSWKTPSTRPPDLSVKPFLLWSLSLSGGFSTDSMAPQRSTCLNLLVILPELPVPEREPLSYDTGSLGSLLDLDIYSLALAPLLLSLCCQSSPPLCEPPDPVTATPTFSFPTPPDPPDPPNLPVVHRSLSFAVTLRFSPPTSPLDLPRRPTTLLLPFPSSSIISPLLDPLALTLYLTQVCSSSPTLFRVEIIGEWKTLALMSSDLLSTLPIDSVLIAFVRSLTVICSLFPSLALVVDFMKHVLPDLWQFGVICLSISKMLVFLDDFSYMELVSLPKFPLGLSGAIARSWSPKSSATSVRVGSLARCFVTREFNANFMIVKPALEAFSISDLGLQKLSYIPQGTISFLLTIVVEFRSLLFGYGGLSVMLAPILVVFTFISALFDAVYLANLALLSFAWNNLSSNEE